MWVALAVLLMAIMLGAAGQICLKFGLGKLGSQTPFVVVTAMFRDWYVLAGFVAYGLSSLMYLFVLSRLDVSYAYPFVAINYIFVTFLAWLILKETVPTLRLVGLAIICTGVLVLSASYKAPQPDSGDNLSTTAIERPVNQG